MEQRDFKGVWITKEIWLDERLNALDKIILVEIDSLDCENSGCFASNKYLADFCQCSETKVSTAISKLIQLNYLYVKSFDGRTRILKSRLTNFERQTYENLKADTQILKENNKNINNKIININIKENKKEKCVEILDYLNIKAGTRYKPVESNLKFISARLKDYDAEDLKQVIDRKVAEWKDTNMQMYLRPETLFNATKFESYFNGLENKKTTQSGTKLAIYNYTDEEIVNMFDNLDEVKL